MIGEMVDQEKVLLGLGLQIGTEEGE